MNNENIQLDDTFEEIDRIFGQYRKEIVTHRDCLTYENSKDFKSTRYFITKYFIDNQFDTTDIRKTLQTKHIDYVNDILLKIDNQRNDNSDNLIKQIAEHDKELPLEFELNKNLSKAEEKASIKNFFGECVTGLSHDINSFSFYSKEEQVTHTRCQHFKKKSKELVFYETLESLTSIISKRLVNATDIYKVYCYCPICKKIYCIYRGVLPVEIRNLIDYIPIGKCIIEQVEKEVDRTLAIPQKLGYCHAFWDLKENILFNKYGLIWYPSSVLNIFTYYD